MPRSRRSRTRARSRGRAPLLIDSADVEAARVRIRGRVRRTPVLAVGGEGGGASRLWLKLEHLQHCGVFKTRGAFNRQLAALERGELDPAAGIVAASGGNAGLANAYAAKALGVPATVFVPRTAPSVKINRIESYGARAVPSGLEYAETYAAAMEYVATTSAVFCHAYDQPEIAAGAGTIALEILEDVPDVDTLVVAVGGGGLYAGVAAAVADRVHVVAVEPTGCPTLHEALRAGAPVDVPVSGLASDALGARRLGEIAFEQAAAHRPTALLVEDDLIADARRRLWEEFRIVSEYGAATAYAAIHGGGYRPAPGERVVVVVCGANTDPATL